MSKRITTEEWIEKAKAVHGSRYDYSKTEYKNSKSKVTITCKKHNLEFYQKATSHLEGHGCLLCGHEVVKCVPWTKVEFVKAAVATHGNRYDYTETEYRKSNEKVKIWCNTHHYFFRQEAASHVAGHGCKKCRRDLIRLTRSKTKEQFITGARKVHGEKYSYEDTEYVNSASKVKIFCSTCGEYFWQTPSDHLGGHACLGCANKIIQTKLSDTIVDFLAKAKAVHGDKYSYDDVVYTGSKNKVKIRCITHNKVFKQTPMNHLQGRNGCSKCNKAVSKGELELKDFLREFVSIESRGRSILKGKEIDILIPSKKVAIEYNGAFWHSEQMHKNPKWHMLEKQADCGAVGIHLIHIMDNDDKVVVKKTLSHILGFDDEKHFARNCSVRVGKSDGGIQKFFKENHLQGGASGCKSYSLVKGGQIVASMLFSIPASERGSKKGNRYELRRFASCCRVVGGASKLLKAFVRDTPECTEIVSYSDNRWFTGNMYKKIGFEEVHETEPDYKYVKNGVVMPKNKFRHSSMKTWNGFDYNPEETEVQNAHRNGWYRIWDCGKKKWELTL